MWARSLWPPQPIGGGYSSEIESFGVARHYDIVVQPPSVQFSNPGINVYVGNGDGTFQSTPFFTIATLPAGYSVISVLIGDLNADGHSDLLIELSTPDETAALSIYLGDGKGNFTTDPNTYFAGSYTEDTSMISSPIATFARINNQSTLPNDYLTFTNNGATSLLNQTNPAPAAPSLIQSSIKLVVSSGSAMPNQQLTFTATVTGANPTGTVTFVNGTRPLGTATISNGTATLSTSFIAINTYSVVANYSGDSLNLPSTSDAVSIVVSIPDFTFSSEFTSGTIVAGQTITTTLTVAPLGDSGTVKFSCTALPSGASCSFSSPTTTLANGLNEITTLTISTTAPSTAASSAPLRKLPGSLPLVAWASLFLCLASSPRRMRPLGQRATRSVVLLLLLISGFLSLSGCSSSPPAAKPSAPGTPTGAQSVTVTAADTAGGPSHTLTIAFTIQ